MKGVKSYIRYGIPCAIIFLMVIYVVKINQRDFNRWQYRFPWLVKSDILNRTNVRGMVCTLLKDEAKYIQEWISFHLLIGVDLFVIYDDNSTDDLVEKLRPFQETVIFIPWGSPDKGRDNNEHIQSTRQISAARHCVTQYGLIPEWLTFLDVDEFIFPCLPKVTDIRLFIQDPAVKLECLKFGTGVEDRSALPNELTVEKYTLRAPYYGIDTNAANIKDKFPSCKAKPELCETEGSQKFLYNTRKYPQNQKILAQTLTMHGSHAIGADSKKLTREDGICCNHYGYRSTIIAMQKAKKNRNSILAMTVMNNESMALFNSVPDQQILRYVNPIRKYLTKLKVGSSKFSWFN